MKTVLAAKTAHKFLFQRLGTKVQRLCFGMKGAKAFWHERTVETLFKLHLGWRVSKEFWDGKNGSQILLKDLGGRFKVFVSDAERYVKRLGMKGSKSLGWRTGQKLCSKTLFG